MSSHKNWRRRFLDCFLLNQRNYLKQAKRKTLAINKTRAVSLGQSSQSPSSSHLLAHMLKDYSEQGLEEKPPANISFNLLLAPQCIIEDGLEHFSEFLQNIGPDHGLA